MPKRNEIPTDTFRHEPKSLRPWLIITDLTQLKLRKESIAQIVEDSSEVVINPKNEQIAREAIGKRKMPVLHLEPSVALWEVRYRPKEPKNTWETEKDFGQSVEDYAKEKGWLVYRTWYNKRDPAGEPDLRLVRPPRVCFVELKTRTGRLTEPQKITLTALTACPGVETYLWRPSNWKTIVEVLT